MQATQFDWSILINIFLAHPFEASLFAAVAGITAAFGFLHDIRLLTELLITFVKLLKAELAELRQAFARLREALRQR